MHYEEYMINLHRGKPDGIINLYSIVKIVNRNILLIYYYQTGTNG